MLAVRSILAVVQMMVQRVFTFCPGNLRKEPDCWVEHLASPRVSTRTCLDFRRTEDRSGLVWGPSAHTCRSLCHHLLTSPGVSSDGRQEEPGHQTSAGLLLVHREPANVLTGGLQRLINAAQAGGLLPFQINTSTNAGQNVRTSTPAFDGLPVGFH